MYFEGEKENGLKIKLSKYVNTKTATSFLCLVLVLLVYLFTLSSPLDFPKDSTFYVNRGETLSGVASRLKENGYVRSSIFFKILVYCFDGKARVKAGNYFFDKRESLIVMAYRINRGRYNTEPVKVLIPEGLNSKEISDLLISYVPGLDKDKFIYEASKKEGYLFPDTYIFSDNMREIDIVNIMYDHFNKKISEPEIDQKVKSFGKPLSDIVKMASILEGEARQFETKRIIAGILWKRISIGMPLQVDATFKYEIGKNSFTLTTEDLRTDSPYNTYTRKGLPPTPISNPGAESILATITPIKTDYLYFLTDKNGVMHYARTHEEHVANKAKYLK